MSQVLLVEGKDDEHVFYALLRKYNVAESFKIRDCEGIDNLLEQIPVQFKGSHIKTVGIVVDADSNLVSRWQQIRDILNSIDFNVPTNLPIDGLILSSAKKKVGVWIMPNNQIPGMLEDFIRFIIPDNDNLLVEVDLSINRIESLELNKYNTNHKSKAQIHTWLAWQEDPGTPLGLAITKQYLNSNSQVCTNLIRWINELFNQ